MILRSPASAIAWQLWRRNRWAALCTLAALPLSLLLNGLMLALLPDVPEVVRVIECFAALASFVAVFWIFSHTDNDTQGRHLGYPARMYTLPARTATLVNWPIAFGLAATLSLYFSWAGIIQWHWDVSVPWVTLCWHALVLAAMLLTLQTLVWSLHRSPWIRSALVIALMTGLGASAILVPEADFQPFGQMGWILALGLWLLAAYAGAFTGVARDRRGAGQGWTARLWQRILDVTPRRSSDFTSAGRAQFWFEWHRRGLFSSCLLGIVMAGSLFFVSLAAAMHLDAVALAMNCVTFPVMIFSVALGAGASLAKSDPWSREKSFHPCNALRPITTGEIVVAKMQAAALITILGWTLFFLLAVPGFNVGHWIGSWTSGGLDLPSWAEFWAQHPMFWRLATHPVILLTAMGVTWLAMMGSMALGLTGRTRTIVFWSWIGMGKLVSLVMATVWLYNHPARWPEALRLLPWITSLFALVNIGLAARNFVRVYRRGLHTPPTFCCLVVIWLALVAALSASAWLFQSVMDWPAPLVAFLAVWLMPGGELAACTINLASNRHR
jgi:hypothetical protein